MGLKDLFARQPHWPDVQSVVQKLNRAEFTAYVAGGAVRDLLLGQKAKDFDVATDAKPEDVEKIFKKTINVGRLFGTTIVPFENHQIEITTFRKDGAYKDGRHPEAVEFSAPEEDAKRRDFTVNALFYDLANDRVIDYVGGLADLERKVLRTVGLASERFEEDKLRVLRAVRFAAQLGFTIDEETLRAVRDFASQIRVVSFERITEEVKKLVRASHVRHGLEILHEVKLLEVIWPELTFVGDRERFKAFLPVTGHLAGSFEMFIALCLIFEGHEVPVPFILSREQKRRVDFLRRGFEHQRKNEIDVLLDMNEEDGPLLTELSLALSGANLLPKTLMPEWIERFLKVSDEHGELPKPWVNGDDLLKLGFKASSQFGQVLNKIYSAQLGGEFASRDEALTAAARLLKN